MENLIPSVQAHHIGYNVAFAFLIHPINIATGEIDYDRLHRAIELKTMSGNLDQAVCRYAAGHGFDWAMAHKTPKEITKPIYEKKWDAFLALLVFGNRLDMGLDTTEPYLLIKKHGRIILTTESLMQDNKGFVAHYINSDYNYPYDYPELVFTTDMSQDHLEFTILVHELIESDAQGNQVGKHILATFEPLEHANYSTQSFEFLKAHAERDQVQSPFDRSFHYDFFFQDWDVVKGVSSEGVLPNGNILRFERTDSY